MSKPCEICGVPSPFFTRRCPEHQRCDGCGTRDAIVYYGDGVRCNGCHEVRVLARIAQCERDGLHTDFTDHVICPWCGDDIGCDSEIEEGAHECGYCGRPYELQIDYTVEYTTNRVEASHAS